MQIKNIKRNPLDYLLTDILPVEISEFFTFRYFYDFLQKNGPLLNKEMTEIVKMKNSTKKQIVLKMTDTPKAQKSMWSTIPFKFHISKKNSGLRELNILQPIAAVQVLYFITAYQDDILIHLQKGSIFSLRYHKKSNSLYYKQRQRKFIEYFSDISNTLQKRTVEQTGRFFEQTPYKSIVGFINSDEWHNLCSKYKYFARIDYKSCFDSIYTHAYKWILSRDVNDSKAFSNTNLFTTIDRLLQNINAYSSNGLVVGPEFSRMLAELLLQKIDVLVYEKLLNNNHRYLKNYSIKRYVDDIFIFTDTDELREYIIVLFRTCANDFLLSLNENKINKENIPFIVTPWLFELNQYCSNMADTLFYTNTEIKQRNRDNKTSTFRTRKFLNAKIILKRDFNDIFSKYQSEEVTLVAYVLSTILNKISHTKTNGNNTIFRGNISCKILYDIFDFIFFIYTHAASFENTQKLLSIISFIKDDVNSNVLLQSVLQQIVNKYAYIFSNNNPNDIINLLLLCIECKLELPFDNEVQFKEKINESDNPINTGVFLIYSQYNKTYFNIILNEICIKIKQRLESIQKKENMLTYREFWWLLVFNKCPYLDSATNILIHQYIQILKNQFISNVGFGKISIDLFINFLENSSEQFFTWPDFNLTNGKSVGYLQEITYRTHERTIFRNYRYSQATYSSIG
jgi:hypothetical protein